LNNPNGVVANFRRDGCVETSLQKAKARLYRAARALSSTLT